MTAFRGILAAAILATTSASAEGPAAAPGAPQQELQDAKASPHMVDGKIQGFVLTGIRPGSVYAKVGLHDGDIVKSINGHTLESMEDTLATLHQFRNETSVELEVVRNGKVRKLTLTLPEK